MLETYFFLQLSERQFYASHLFIHSCKRLMNSNLFSRCVSHSNQRVISQGVHVILNAQIIVVADVKLVAVILVVVGVQGLWDPLSVRETYERQQSGSRKRPYCSNYAAKADKRSGRLRTVLSNLDEDAPSRSSSCSICHIANHCQD